MKPDTGNKKKLRLSSGLISFPAFLLFCNSLSAQIPEQKDSLPDITVTTPVLRVDNIRLSFESKNLSTNKYLIPPGFNPNERTLIFLDSLKSKASKTLITRKLYDFLIIAPQPSPEKKEINGLVELNFTDHSGKKIRNIKIKRLDVFGTNIYLPDISDPNKIENLLNKTHFNTNENIIRKNLLFSAGDTVSPLDMSDNERIIRQLPYIDDARIIIIPVSEEEVDVVVLTKDLYSLAAEISFSGVKKGSASVFEKNLFGMGHEFGVEVPHDTELPDSPGFGIKYLANNLIRTFINLNLFYFEGLGKKTYGFDISRDLITSSTKYAGGVSVRQMFTTEDLDTLAEPEPLKYNLQDYWLARSFLLNRESVTRLVLGARYYNNNVFDRPFVLPDSYHNLQRHKMFLGSASISARKFYKTNLVYGYGRTEDMPVGWNLNITAGKEVSEFKTRLYTSGRLSFARSIKWLGYFYNTAALATYFNEGRTEQGALLIRTNFISNLSNLGNYKIRNFINFDYTRGFDRYSDEYLVFNREHGFSGFRNDSIGGNQRLSIGLESVLFSPLNLYGFRFAVFGFADFGFLFGTNNFIGSGENLTGVGVGIRVGNDNLVFKTFQIRLGFFPNPPDWSRINYLLISGEPRLKPHIFEPGPPSILPFQ